MECIQKFDNMIYFVLKRYGSDTSASAKQCYKIKKNGRHVIDFFDHSTHCKASKQQTAMTIKINVCQSNQCIDTNT